MPIEHRTGDIFEQPDGNAILHVCNLKQCFGAGIAKVIKEKYPEAYDADLATGKDNLQKLGSYSVGVVKSNGLCIVNIYAMPDFGQFSYDAFDKALSKLEFRINAFNLAKPDSTKTILIPYGIGAGLAQGKYTVIKAIIDSIFIDSPVKCVIVKLSNQKELK